MKKKNGSKEVCSENIELLCPAQLSRKEEFAQCVPSATLKTSSSRKKATLSIGQAAIAHLFTVLGIGSMAHLSGTGITMNGVIHVIQGLKDELSGTTKKTYFVNTVTYEKVDVEIAAKGSIYEGFPSEDIRLTLDSYAPAVIMIGSTLLFWFVLVPIIFPMFKPKTDSGRVVFGRLRSIHNFALFLFSGFCTFVTAKYMYDQGDFSNGVEQVLCTRIEGTYLTPLYWSFTLSKVWEWIDTAFMVWIGKRPPQFIHLYHHATTFWLFILIGNFPGSQKFGLLLNGGVHTMMYSHYWRQWPSFLVPLITILQIIQLAAAMWSWRATPNFCSDQFAHFAENNLLEYTTPFLMVPVFFHQFNQYFAKRWFKI
ncbi:elongation of very long chain fatty acids protein [bacterium]|nr:elongation of very long chain fatty acids protein [bacterium]